MKLLPGFASQIYPDRAESTLSRPAVSENRKLRILMTIPDPDFATDIIWNTLIPRLNPMLTQNGSCPKL
jgi:putative ribosome biogenesis GTPase RsgA